MESQDWNRVTVADKTTIWLNSTLRMSRRKPRQRVVRRSVKFPLKVYVWGCLSCKEFGKIMCFTENFNSTILCT